MRDDPHTRTPGIGTGTRRGFLAGIAGTAAAGALAAAARTIPAPDPAAGPAPAASADPTRLTYRETEHIRHYYARLRY